MSSKNPQKERVREIILEKLPERAMRSNERLRGQLRGSVGIHFTDEGKDYFFDWSGNEPHIEEGAPGNPDCKLTMSEMDFEQIADGKLNPQIAMLSDKIHVEGNSGLAIYFFNLIAPYH
ncbi:MAG: hypothetical protein D6719_13455 [Candidatus Dadabacteria bacterium]|nr:MAG: hypothetical protein D6719_13455 [Candidatus Dadabacteria bacterium]